MATEEKAKKPRKPRKKSTEKTVKKPRKPRKKTVGRSIVPSAKVLYKDRIQLYELSTLTYIEDNELSTISIDTSITGGDGSEISSYGTPLYRFSGIKDSELSSDVPYLLDESVAKRYHTKANELSAEDLRIFSEYSQQGRKNTYFIDHPYVVNDIGIASLEYDQLLTKNNLEEAERYFTNRFLNSKSSLKTFNWETDKESVENDGLMTQEISGIDEMLELDKWDSQATYKFEWGNDRRTTNIVDLNLNAAYYYSVIGIVSVKSIIPEQKSGTIYLEAKSREQSDADDNWIVVDSAVFKFDKDNKNSGTYVTLHGYMSPKYVTRLRLNLHPNAYSMNVWEYREQGSIANHYSNTFVGTAYIMDDVLSGDTLDVPISINFTDSNYRRYKFDNNNVINVDLTEDFLSCFEDTQVFSIPVSDVINKISNHSQEITSLDISTQTQSERDGFRINGLRYSPTGKIYPITGKMNLFSNCTLYPSYSSGTITAQESSLGSATYMASLGEAWQNGKVLENLNLSAISALPKIDWPENTEIYGNHEFTGTIKMVTTTSTSSVYSETTPARGGPIKIGKKSVESMATYNPRVDNQLKTLKIDFSSILKNYNLTGDITCDITATPSTYGGGGGNESWGRIRYGFTTAKQLSENNTSAISTIVSPVKLSTKNITRWITNKMCTGSRWNVHAGTLKTRITQPSRYQQIWIQACADTGKGDTKPTKFSVTVNLDLHFKNIVSVQRSIDSTSTDISSSSITCSTTHTKENIVQDSFIYPNLSESRSVTSTTAPSVTNTFRVDEITATAKFRNTELTVIPYPHN